MAFKRIISCGAAAVLCATLVSSAFASGSKDSAEQEQPTEEEVTQLVTVPVEAPDASKATTAASGAAYIHELPDGDSVAFHEVWGYVMAGREGEFDPSMPITDLCYFSADVNTYGELTTIPDPAKIKGFKGRMHLVITCEGRALTHFSLDPEYPVRKKLVADIAKAAKKFDGVQIDFETIAARDGANFRSFLADVRKAIGEEKWFSIAVPARVRDISDDIFRYKQIEPLVDRMIIMAYDEHWSGSKPGSIASIDWCERVVAYCSSVIPQKKLVMGLPFYGRTWVEPSLASAWYYSGINRIMNENNAHAVERDNGVPYFSFTRNVTVTGYFEDSISLVTRLRMYQSNDVRKIAFWRIGQEDPTFWGFLALD